MTETKLANNFLFTQHSLSTFEKCPIKFKKRYIENLKWDSFPGEEARKRIEKGRDFHLLAHRYFLGIDTGLNEFAEEFGELNGWMESLKNSFDMAQGVRYLPEYRLQMSFSDFRLAANFDLLVVKEDTLEIWDWKTHGGNVSSKKALENVRLKDSLQTVVYMFVLKEQAALVTGKETECEKISMHYWQPEPLGVAAEIKYSSSMHGIFKEMLKAKIHDIQEYNYDNFDKTLYSDHCKHCEFNWCCNNGRVDFEALDDIEIDL